MDGHESLHIADVRLLVYIQWGGTQTATKSTSFMKEKSEVALSLQLLPVAPALCIDKVADVVVTGITFTFLPVHERQMVSNPALLFYSKGAGRHSLNTTTIEIFPFVRGG